MNDETVASDPLRRAVAQIQEEVGGRVLGQSKTIELVMVSFIAGGHVLLEGRPGVGKTLLARCFSAATGLDFKRLQFTPDLMPSDVTGTNVFDPQERAFRLFKGPVFCDVLMADEINRTPPKTQAALLEAMQERQVTIDGEPHVLSDCFFVIATQNPIEFEGTYRLPEAQADRFLLLVDMDLPRPEDELLLYQAALNRRMSEWRAQDLPPGLLGQEQAHQLRQTSSQIHVADALLEYLLQLAGRLRDSDMVELAPSPRGALALLEASRALAWLRGRDFVVPEDIQDLVQPCWRHRVVLTADAELEGHSAARLLDETVTAVPVPRTS